MAVPRRRHEHSQHLVSEVVHLLLSATNNSRHPSQGSSLHLGTQRSQHGSTGGRVHGLLGGDQDTDLVLVGLQRRASFSPRGLLHVRSSGVQYDHPDLTLPVHKLTIVRSCQCVLKVVYLDDVIHATDPTYTPVRVEDIVAIVEQNGGTFVANLPSIKVLLAYIATTASQSYTALISRTFSRSSTTRDHTQDEARAGSEDISLDRVSNGRSDTSDFKAYDRVSPKDGSIVRESNVRQV
nr:hypothetical protein CFP56_10505 [Quercus suber]